MKLESLQLMQMQLEWIGVGYCIAILPLVFIGLNFIFFYWIIFRKGVKNGLWFTFKTQRARKRNRI